VTRVISVANQKGGVGKTTTALNLAVCLGRAGQQTLLLDFDPQCNATSGLGLEPLSAKRHPLLGGAGRWHLAKIAGPPGLAVVPGCRALAGDAPPDAAQHQRHGAADRLGKFLTEFDCVLIDCPPSLGWLTRTALDVSTEVLVPIQCEYFAMEGLSQMVEVVQQAGTTARRRPVIGGIVLTMFDPAQELTHEVADEVAQYFGDRVFPTAVPRDVALAEAPSHGLSVLDYAPRSRGTRAYVELTLEVIDRG
jgi:chromosome partitioning protein